jgi:hypothetical protein
MIMADQINAVGNEVGATGKWNDYQERGGVAIQTDRPLLMGFVREGDKAICGLSSGDLVDH